MFKRCNACTAGYHFNKIGKCDCGGVLEDSFIDETPTVRVISIPKIRKELPTVPIPVTAKIIAKNSERKAIIVTARPKPLKLTGSINEICKK